MMEFQKDWGFFFYYKENLLTSLLNWPINKLFPISIKREVRAQCLEDKQGYKSFSHHLKSSKVSMSLHKAVCACSCTNKSDKQ